MKQWILVLVNCKFIAVSYTLWVMIGVYTNHNLKVYDRSEL